MSDDENDPVASRKNPDADATSAPDAAPFERWLDRKLKTAYGSVLDEPIPQDIIDLLRKKLDNQ